MTTRQHDEEVHDEAHDEVTKPEPKKPEHPMRSALLSAFRNTGMTADQAEGVVKAFEDYLTAGTKH